MFLAYDGGDACARNAFRGTNSSVWQEWSILDITVPHGNGGKMALTFPCVAGKHIHVDFIHVSHDIKRKFSLIFSRGS